MRCASPWGSRGPWPTRRSGMIPSSRSRKSLGIAPRELKGEIMGKVVVQPACCGVDRPGERCFLSGWSMRPSGRLKPGANRADVSERDHHDGKPEILLYLPKGYGEEKDQKWPLILFLHGAGERGSNLELVKKHGPPRLIEQGREFPFIIASPQCPSGSWWTEKLDSLLALLDDIQSKYAVDPNRVYLTGLSMGGFGSWSLGCRHPERFAAIVRSVAAATGFWPKGSRTCRFGRFMGPKTLSCRCENRMRWSMP